MRIRKKAYFSTFKRECTYKVNKKPEGPVFIYNPLESDGFYGSIESFFKGAIKFTKIHSTLRGLSSSLITCQN